MINQQNINRLAICTIALVMGVGVSFATGGDEKEKEKERISSSTASKDTVYVDLDPSIQVDDTLVFEDWDDGQGGDFGGNGGIGVADNGSSDFNGSGLGNALFGEAATENLNNIYQNAFQKEYKVEFSVYPNPTVDRITIEPNLTPQSIRIIDITGKTHRDTGYSSSIDVLDLPSGTYILNLIYPDHIEARRFIKR